MASGAYDSPKHWPVVARAAGISLDELQPESTPSFPESPNRKPNMSEQRASSATDVPEGATAALVLADGTVFWGIGFGAAPTDEAIGEICFSTGMTGYQETLTDPSFAGQIITFTFPHIGNVGTNSEDDEALRVAARGLVVKQDLTEPANWRSTESLDAWLKERNVPGICGVDTRALTLRIRDGGPQTAVLVPVSNGQIDLDAAKAKSGRVAGSGRHGPCQDRDVRQALHMVRRRVELAVRHQTAARQAS